MLLVGLSAVIVIAMLGRLSLGRLVLLTTTGLVLLAAVGLARIEASDPNGQRRQYLQENNLSGVGGVLALSASTGPWVFGQSLQAIPETIPYQRGNFFLRDTLAQLPFVSAPRSDWWITEAVLQRDPAAIGGSPPTLVGGLYIDFGLVGIVIGCALIGFGLVRLFHWARAAGTFGALTLYGYLSAYVALAAYSYISLKPTVVVVVALCLMTHFVERAMRGARGPLLDDHAILRPDRVKVLVTGAAGFIGSHLVEECLRRGWEVVAVDSLTTYYSPAAKVRNASSFHHHHRCTYLEQDLLDLDLKSILADTSLVFHLAAQAGVRASWGQSFDVYTQLNITLLQRLLEAARESDIHRFVFASSSSVYGDAEARPTTEEQVLRPLSPYGATKALGEHLTHLYFRNYGVPAVTLRYFSVYGPRQRPDMAFHRAIEAGLAGRAFRLFGDGRQTRDFTYVDDIVAGTILAADAPAGAVYNLGGGSNVSMLEVLAFIDEELGGGLEWTVEDVQRGDARDTSADITAARQALRYEPRWDVKSGLTEQIAWHRSRVR